MSVVSFNPANTLSLTPTAAQTNSVNTINNPTAAPKPTAPPPSNSPMTAPQNGNYSGFWNSSGATINPTGAPNMANLTPTFAQLNGATPATPAVPGTSSATPATPSSGSWQNFNPTYQNNGWNPDQYATDATANDVASRLGGSVMRTDTSMNPGGGFAVPAQNMIDLGGEDGLNAGLLAKRYASMSKAQADALTQAELATMGRRTSTNDQDQANATAAGGTPTYAGRGATSAVSPLAAQAFASANGMPKGLAYQAGYNANGKLMPGAAQFGQQQSQYAQNQQNDGGQNQQFMQQIQQLMPILQMLGGFGRGGQGVNLSQLFSGMQQHPQMQGMQQPPQYQQRPQRTPYGYTQWNGPSPTGDNSYGTAMSYDRQAMGNRINSDMQARYGNGQGFGSFSQQNLGNGYEGLIDPSMSLGSRYRNY